MNKQLDLSNTKIYTKEDVIEVIGLIGQKVYLSTFSDFNTYDICDLVGIKYIEDNLCPFIGRAEGDKATYTYRYFILAKDAKFKDEEKAYKIFRPYKNISEFCNETGCEEVGTDLITIRNKRRKQECVLLYTGYSEDAVHLGGYVLTFETLVKHYEFYSEGKWLSLGIEEWGKWWKN